LVSKTLKSRRCVLHHVDWPPYKQKILILICPGWGEPCCLWNIWCGVQRAAKRSSMKFSLSSIHFGEQDFEIQEARFATCGLWSSFEGRWKLVEQNYQWRW
jgi:hypothetical protein